MNLFRFGLWAPLLISGLVVGCGSDHSASSGSASEPFVSVTGQVSLDTPRPRDPGGFAAARFLEQASWGPNERAVEEVRRLGFSAWIDQQTAMAPSLMNPPSFVINYNNIDRAADIRAMNWVQSRFMDISLSGNDQLRQRVSWALFNFIPNNGGGHYAKSVYFNLLQRHAFSPYADLLKAVTLDSGMGEFLNNNQNIVGRPNENYARELMQLFSVGLVLLNPDGTLMRNARGQSIETYTQRDVVDATKALSGWKHVYMPNLPNSNGGNYGVPMRPHDDGRAHDYSEKRVLGKAITAGQSPEKDLETLLGILVGHPNAGPFVSQRLIQHLVTSEPSPQYVARVSKVFRETSGNLGQVVKAILLDPEARAGDDPAGGSSAGRIKEPMFVTLGTLRAMSCSAAISHYRPGSHPIGLGQDRLTPPSVFGYVSPFHRAPESLTLAPEQRLLTWNSFEDRSYFSRPFTRNLVNFRAAGCEVDAMLAAAQQSYEHFMVDASKRFFRGAMPPALMHQGLALMRDANSNNSIADRVERVLAFLMLSPSYGVVK